jgi:hypothetical protein
MSTESPNDIGRAAIEEHAQRSTEQTALRKVRKTLDRIEESAAGERRALKYVLALCALLAAVGVWFFWGLLFGASEMPKQPPLKIPATLPQKQ